MKKINCQLLAAVQNSWNESPQKGYFMLGKNWEDLFIPNFQNIVLRDCLSVSCWLWMLTGSLLSTADDDLEKGLYVFDWGVVLFWFIHDLDLQNGQQHQVLPRVVQVEDVVQSQHSHQRIELPKLVVHVTAHTCRRQQGGLGGCHWRTRYCLVPAVVQCSASGTSCRSHWQMLNITRKEHFST